MGAKKLKLNELEYSNGTQKGADHDSHGQAQLRTMELETEQALTELIIPVTEI